MIHRLTRLAVATLMVLAAPSVFAHPDARHSLETIDAHIAESQRDARLHLTKAGILLGIDHVAEAIRCVDTAAQIDPHVTGLGWMEARLFLAAGNGAAARKRVEASLQIEPDHVESLRLARQLATDAGDLDAALPHALALLTLPEPPSPDDVGRCASLYLHRQRPGDDDLALKALDAGLGRLGCLTGLHAMACDIEIRLARYDAALARLGLLSAKLRPRVDFEIKRAEILVKAGRPGDAAQAYDNALAIMDAAPRERQMSPVFQTTRLKFAALRDDLRRSVPDMAASGLKP